MCIRDRLSEIEPFARSGSFPDPLPSFTFQPECADDRNPCGFTSSAEVWPQFGDSDSPSPCASDWACANNEQSSAYVTERRIVAKISVAVQAGDGNVLATREADVTLRTLNVPPYVALSLIHISDKRRSKIQPGQHWADRRSMRHFGRRPESLPFGCPNSSVWDARAIRARRPSVRSDSR